MTTKIYRDAFDGSRRNFRSTHITYWCGHCYYPLTGTEERCKSPELLQQCWDMGLSANQWHLRHECPFVHQGLECRCNDFPSIEKAQASLTGSGRQGKRREGTMRNSTERNVQNEVTWTSSIRIGVLSAVLRRANYIEDDEKVVAVDFDERTNQVELFLQRIA